MSSRNQTTPAIRFKGYINDWEQCKVSDMSEETFGGGTPKTGNKEYWLGDLPWIQSSDLKNEKLSNVKPTKFITDEAIKKSAAKAIPSNSIAIVTRVGVGKLALMPFPYATSQDFFSLSRLTVDPWFGVYSLYTLIQREINNIQGTSIKGMTKSDLLDKNIQIPPHSDEQTKIGAFFKQLDDTIALHQQQLNNFKNLKKTMLEKVFNQELRFKDENGNEFPNWIEKQLGELGEFKNGLNKDKSDFGFGFPFVNLQDVFENKSSDISRLGLVNSTEKDRWEFSLLKDDILFIRSSVKISGVGLVDVILKDLPNTTYSGFIIRFRHNNEYLLSNFLKFYSNTNHFRGEVLKKATTSANTNINQDSLSTLIVKIPCLVEQKKIIDLLFNMDQKLSESEKKLGLMKQQKKWFMKKMFV